MMFCSCGRAAGDFLHDSNVVYRAHRARRWILTIQSASLLNGEYRERLCEYSAERTV